MQRAVTVLSLAAALAQPVAAAAQDEPSALTPAQRVHGLSLIWSEARYSFAFFDQVPALDWDSAYQAYVPRVYAAESTYEYYQLLARFAGLLEDGHTFVNAPAGARDTYPWIATEAVDGHIVVRAVGRSIMGRIPPGSEIVRIDGQPAAAVALERRSDLVFASTEHDRSSKALRQALYGPPDTDVAIAWVTADGARGDTVLQRDRRLREDEWVPDINAVPLIESRWLDGDVLHVALNTFNNPDILLEWADSLPSYRRARGLVIDIRRNGGGNSANGWGIAAWLTDDSVANSIYRTREHVAAYKGWNRGAYGRMDAWREGAHGKIVPEDGDRIVVPTAVLIGTRTYSAAEDFAVVMDQMPHVTLVGSPTGGSTGNPIFFQLPGGGSAGIVSKRDTYPDGTEFVGVGVQPDIAIEQSFEDYRAGRDPVLERALKEVRSRL